MRTSLRLAALFLLVAAPATWLVTGANRVWSKTSVPVAKKDPVTEIEYQKFEKRFRDQPRRAAGKSVRHH